MSSRKLGLTREQYAFLKDDHDAIDQFELLFEQTNADHDTLVSLSAFNNITLDIDGTLAANSDTRVASQKATKTYVDSLSLNVGTKFSYFDGGSVSGTVTLQTIDINETMTAWYSTSGATSFVLPASGTFNYRASTESTWNAGLQSTAARAVAGGATVGGGGVAGGFVLFIIYTRTP